VVEVVEGGAVAGPEQSRGAAPIWLAAVRSRDAAPMEPDDPGNKVIAEAMVVVYA